MRFPIAVKFAVFLAILVVAFMFWMITTAVRVAQSRLETEINKSGVVLVCAISGLLDPPLIRSRNRDELVARLAAFADAEGQSAAVVLNVVLYDAADNALATARDETRFHLTTSQHPISDSGAAREGVEIRELAINNAPARSFSRRLVDPQGSLLGRVELYLSAVEIDRSLAALQRAMLTVSTTAFVVAVAASFLLARFLTRPIRLLRRDMRAVSHGDLAHQSRVHSWDELGDLARSFNLMTSSLQSAQEAKLEQKALEQELEIATEIQRRLLPAEMPRLRSVDLAAQYVPAREVGGDYYDFIPIDERRLGIVVADVSGKSVPGSLIMTMTRSLLRLAASGDTSPSRTVQLVNRFLSPDVTPGMFVTLAYIVLDCQSFEAKLVRCGHNAPLLFSAAQHRVLRLQPGGLALCLDREGNLFRSELQVQRFQLLPGDVLLLYTDGVTEAKDGEGRDYGDTRLSNLLDKQAQQTATDLLDCVVEDIRKHQRNAPQSDDITLVALKRTREPA